MPGRAHGSHGGKLVRVALLLDDKQLGELDKEANRLMITRSVAIRHAIDWWLHNRRSQKGRNVDIALGIED
jgi:metal-responsive CopG/Arc/MetJ family transcriptional regulator